MKMKIIYATDTYWPRTNGVTVSIETNKKQLQQYGHEVHVLAPDYPANDGDRDMADGNIHRFSSYKLLFISGAEDRLVYPWKKKEVFNVLDSVKPDLIHIQTEFTMGIFAMKYAKKHNIPIITTSHTYFEEYFRYYLPFLPGWFAHTYSSVRTKRFHNKANIVIAPTERMKSVLETYNIRKPIEVIPTGISTSDFIGVNRSKEKRESFLFKEYPQIKGKPILLYVGRIGGEKNIIFLFHVMASIIKDIPDTTLLLVGDGPQREELQQLAIKLKIQDNIIFLGYMDRAKIKYIYSFADVFVFASKTETQGMVTIESMMCKTPVVAIGIMGTKDVMKGDNGGYMVPEDINIFSEKVKNLMTDTKLHKTKSAEAFTYARNWTLDKTCKEMETLYKSLV